MEGKIDILFNNIKRKYNCGYVLKEEQKLVIAHILSGKDTLCVLPTGFGKSECFILPPLLLQEVGQFFPVFFFFLNFLTPFGPLYYRNGRTAGFLDVHTFTTCSYSKIQCKTFDKNRKSQHKKQWSAFEDFKLPVVEGAGAVFNSTIQFKKCGKA